MTKHIATWWIQGNNSLVSLTDKGIHDIEDILIHFKNAEPDIVRLACPLLRAVVSGWYDLTDDKRQALYDLYRLYAA